VLQIPEHTWGFDTKTFLHDNANWANKDFHAQLDAHAQNFEDNIAQWQRQRGYLTWALEALDLSLRQSSLPLSQTLQSDSTQNSAQGSGYDSAHTASRRELSAHDSDESAPATAAESNIPGLSLAQELDQLRTELQRQHELTDVEGYEEHPVGEALKLKSQFWKIEVDTTTGKIALLTRTRSIVSWACLHVTDSCYLC